MTPEVPFNPLKAEEVGRLLIRSAEDDLIHRSLYPFTINAEKPPIRGFSNTEVGSPLSSRSLEVGLCWRGARCVEISLPLFLPCSHFLLQDTRVPRRGAPAGRREQGQRKAHFPPLGALPRRCGWTPNPTCPLTILGLHLAAAKAGKGSLYPVQTWASPSLYLLPKTASPPRRVLGRIK